MAVDVTRKAAASLAKLGHLLVEREHDSELLDQLTAEVERWTALVECAPVVERSAGAVRHDVLGGAPDDGAPMQHYERCPVCGPSNPFALGLRARRDGDEVVCEVVLGAGAEGAPGRSHGGAVAALFDDATAYLGVVLQQTWFAGELSVRYRRPFPVGVTVEIRARVRERTGRRVFTEATASYEGEVVAEATCTKVLVELA